MLSLTAACSTTSTTNCQASTQARLDTDRLRLLLEANYNAWRTTRRDKDSPSSSWRHDVQATSKSGIVSERASPAPADAGRLADPQALTDRSHRKLPRPSLMSPDEMPYIPMLRIHECTRPSFLRAVSSPPWQPHTQSIQALTSSGPQSVRHPQSSNTPPATAYLDPLSSSAGITRTSTAPPTSPRQPLDGLNIGPIFDNSKSPTHGVQGVPPRPPKILPSHVSAGYQPHPRKPASFIPVHSVEPASSSTSRAIRIPITSTEGEERITSLGSSSIHPPTKLHSPVAAASPSLVKTGEYSLCSR